MGRSRPAAAPQHKGSFIPAREVPFDLLAQLLKGWRTGAPSVFLAFKFLGAVLGHAAQAFGGFDAGDRALAGGVVAAVGVAVLHPQPLRSAQRLALTGGDCIQALL